jgi:hypothetical protein
MYDTPFLRSLFEFFAFVLSSQGRGRRRGGGGTLRLPSDKIIRGALSLSKAAVSVSKVFERCYADTEPFEYRP